MEGYISLDENAAWAQWVWVGPRYLETLGMTQLAGRDIGLRDIQGAPKVAVVNETFVRRYFPDRNPIGKGFSIGASAKRIEIVGVVRDSKFNNPRQEYWPVAFLPIVQSDMLPARYAAYLEVRTIGDAASMAGSVRQALHEVDRNLPVTGIKTLRRQIDESLNQERLVAGLSGFFSLLALLLACIGLYGVLAHAVNRRSKELGIRVALGAQAGDVLRLVAGQGMALAAIGVAIGLAAAWALTRLMSSLLFGIGPTDPLTFASVSLLLVVVAAAASFIPARRAMKIDPMSALRCE